jgi:hypothetical protein
MCSGGLVTFLLSSSALKAETTNTLSDTEIQGRALAHKILEQQPAENSTNMALLKVRDENGNRIEYPISCVTLITATDWSSIYQLFDPTNSSHAIKTLTVLHDASHSNQYQLHFDFNGNREWTKDGQTVIKMLSFGGDFGCADLGLEFFHWPGQKILKKEVHRSCGCTVLESTNPDPSTSGYSRVVSWIDNDSLGIVEAYAYDSRGKLLKDFYPKDIRKVNGQWQVQTLVMDNVQTGSRSRLEFDLKN